MPCSDNVFRSHFSKVCTGKAIDPHTGQPQPSYRLMSGLKVMMEFKKAKAGDLEDMEGGGVPEEVQELRAYRVHEILKRIPDDDCIAMGFDCV